jgi:hypothetical protein
MVERTIFASWRRLHRHHEALVDLELVHRQALQVGQRRIAGAEVVDRQLEAAAPTGVQHGLGALGVVHDRAFGDLQAKAACALHAVARQMRASFCGSSGSSRSRVDRLTDTLGTPSAASGRLAPRHLLEHPQRELAHEAGLLGKRDELHRRHQAAHRMLPAHQRLGAAQRCPCPAHLGLQVQAQFVALHRLAQLGQQRQRLRAGVVKCRCRRAARRRCWRLAAYMATSACG